MPNFSAIWLRLCIRPFSEARCLGRHVTQNEIPSMILGNMPYLQSKLRHLGRKKKYFIFKKKKQQRRNGQTIGFLYAMQIFACGMSSGSMLFATIKCPSVKKLQFYFVIITIGPSIFTMDNPKFNVSNHQGRFQNQVRLLLNISLLIQPVSCLKILFLCPLKSL